MLSDCCFWWDVFRHPLCFCLLLTHCLHPFLSLLFTISICSVIFLHPLLFSQNKDVLEGILTMHLEYIGRGGIFKIYTLLPFSRHPSCRFLNWSKNCVLVILFFFFFSLVPDRKLLMTAAGSIHNHLGWLGLWPLAESDNSELRDFYPPLNSKREPERERKEALLGLSKGRRSTSEKRGAGERMRRDMKWKKGWRHRKRWEDHTLQLTPEVLTLSGRHKHRKEVKSMKGEGGREKDGIKRSEM